MNNTPVSIELSVAWKPVAVLSNPIIHCPILTQQGESPKPPRYIFATQADRKYESGFRLPSTKHVSLNQQHNISMITAHMRVLKRDAK